MEREFGIWTFLPAISIGLETFSCMMAKHDVEFDIVNFALKKGKLRFLFFPPGKVMTL